MWVHLHRSELNFSITDSIKGDLFECLMMHWAGGKQKFFVLAYIITKKGGAEWIQMTGL